MRKNVDDGDDGDDGDTPDGYSCDSKLLQMIL